MTQEQQSLEQAIAEFNVKAQDAIKFLDYAASRWEDEKEYEDFTDYQTQVIKRFVALGAEGCTLTRAFKCVVTMPTFIMTIKVNKNSIKTIAESR